MKQQKHSIQNAATLLAALPKQVKHDWRERIRAVREQKLDAIIVLDDDPTGTQTVYDIPVLTDWSIETIKNELKANTPIFYILTNSRSLPQPQADDLALTIGKNIRAANQNLDKKIMVISRGDSTLRGHFPSEVDCLKRGLNMTQGTTILIPAFFEGGRYTVTDIHYVKQADQFVPTAQTPYAQDSAFGYRNSDLKDWVAEKTAGKVEAASVVSFSIEELRTKSIAQLVEKLEAEQSSDCYIVNAVDYTDLEIFAYALLQTSIPFVCRTAASFVAALAALPDKPLLKKSDLVQADATNGGLIIVGSHVPKTTRQLEHLRRSVDVEAIELDVQKLINDYEQRVALAKQYSIAIDQLIAKGRDVVLYTSRAVVIADSAADNLSIGAKISAFLSRVVAQLQHRPKYVLAKGGITSSDVATVSLGVKRAVVIGQVLPGIPVWRLGKSSKFPDLSYLIFPGNVGEDDAIASVVQALV